MLNEFLFEKIPDLDAAEEQAIGDLEVRKQLSSRVGMKGIERRGHRSVRSVARDLKECITSGTRQCDHCEWKKVVWNPWDKKAKAIPDLGDEDYKHMLCIESAAIEKPITLKPGEEWKGRQELSAVPSSYFSGKLDPQRVL